MTKAENLLNTLQHLQFASVSPGTETGCVLLQSDSDDSIWGSKRQHHLPSSSTAVLTEDKKKEKRKKTAIHARAISKLQEIEIFDSC